MLDTNIQVFFSALITMITIAKKIRSYLRIAFFTHSFGSEFGPEFSV
jgi:hypothetical protein